MKLVRVGVCVVLSVAVVAVPHAVGQVSDRSVKAAFLVRFADFVTWPDEQDGQTRPLTICLSQSHQFGSAVTAAAKGMVVRGRPVSVRQVVPADGLSDCQMLYVAPADEHLLSASRNRPILTVGERQGFCQRGGVINLRVVDDRVRFEVSLTHSRAAGLSVNSQLLRLAFVVHGGRK